jgi:hypothetical protein
VSKAISKGRFQINKNVFAACYLDIIEANNQEVRLVLSSKKRGDHQVPLGTRIYMDLPSYGETARSFDTVSVTVLKIEEADHQLIHVCTPIQKSTHPDRRQQPRRMVDFPVLLVDSQTLFLAVNGTASGLALRYAAQRAMLKLTIGQSYQFKFNCKGEDCVLRGLIKHIQYDWQTFEHQVGVSFPSLSKDEEIMLNLMVDPDYTVPISTRQTIDSGAGKISRND